MPTTLASKARWWIAHIATPLGMIGAIVGARSPEQVDGWTSAATLKLDADDLAAIATAIEKTGAGSGPARPA